MKAGNNGRDEEMKSKGRMRRQIKRRGVKEEREQLTSEWEQNKIKKKKKEQKIGIVVGCVH